MVNYQAYLAAEGLQVFHGVPPSPGNISDNPDMAWNDSIMELGSSSSNSSERGILIPMAPHDVVTVTQPPVLELNISVSNLGMQINMEAHGDIVSSLMINEFVPVMQLNSFVTRSLRPLTATFGPWAEGYGFAYDCLKLKVNMEQSQEGFSFTSAAQLSANGNSIMTVSMGTISEDVLTSQLNMFPVLPVDSTTEPLRLTGNNDSSVTSVNYGGNSRISEIQDLGLASLQPEGNMIQHGPSGPMVTRGRKPKPKLPECSIQLRHSERSNKYDGFKVPPVSDTRPRASKVKARSVPSAVKPVMSEDLEEGEIPPPTTIHAIQEIGTHCAVPAEEMTKELLCQDPTTASSSGAATGCPPSDSISGTAQGDGPSSSRA